MPRQDPDRPVTGAELVADLREKGGGTYTKGFLARRNYNTGYAVAKAGISLPASIMDEPEALRFILYAVGQEFDTPLVGTWLDDGRVYFDAVQYFQGWAAQPAIRFAVEHNQQAVWDFAAGVAVSVGKVEFDQ